MPRAEYKVVGLYPIVEYDEEGYPTGRDAMPGETLFIDDDEHHVEIGGIRRVHRIDIQALLATGCVAPVEKAAKAEGTTKKAVATSGDAGA
jgi:hypothetical protein